MASPSWRKVHQKKNYNVSQFFFFLGFQNSHFRVPSPVVFRMYDLDESGYISKEEMTTILESFYKLIGSSEDNPLATFSGKKYDTPHQLVEEIFEQMDVTGDGKISLAEYQSGAIKNPDIIQGLKLFADDKP